VADGNAAHKRWSERKLLELLGSPGAARDARPLAGRVVAIWGLTYKPGTDTLRRSSAVELCRRLAAAGAEVVAHDPALSALPADLASIVELRADPLAAARGADALVVCTPWPEYRELGAREICSSLGRALVIDPAGVLKDTFVEHPDVRYVRVGGPSGVGAEATPEAQLSEGL